MHRSPCKAESRGRALRRRSRAIAADRNADINGRHVLLRFYLCPASSVWRVRGVGAADRIELDKPFRHGSSAAGAFQGIVRCMATLAAGKDGMGRTAEISRQSMRAFVDALEQAREPRSLAHPGSPQFSPPAASSRA